MYEYDRPRLPLRSPTRDPDLGNSKYGTSYRRTGSTVGFTGHIVADDESIHILESPLKKLMIRGYTGHRSKLKNLVGEPFIPSEERQQSDLFGLPDTVFAEEDREEGNNYNFRTFAKHLDVMERYTFAVEQLQARGQSQESLLQIVQAKLSQRVSTFAMQAIMARKLFEEFDMNGDGVLDEGEFRECLEKMTIQFDDVQSLALFAYFDDNNDGFVEWQNFADHAMVPNPKGGTAVIPKMINSLHAGPGGPKVLNRKSRA
jgi:hypothetical protein